MLHFPFFLKARNSCLSNLSRPEILECNNGQKLPVGKFIRRMIEPCYRTKQAFFGIMSHNYSKPLKENRKVYALFYFKTGEFKLVSKKVFSKLSYPVLDYEWCVVRVVDSPSRKASSQSLNKILPDMYHGQGLFSKMSGAMDDISSLSSCFMSAVATIKGLDKKSIVKFLSIFFKITALFGERTFNASNVVSIVLDLYLIYLETQFEAQGIEAMASIAMASFMPEQLFNIIRKSQVLSSSKLIDDSSVFHDFIVSIVGSAVS